MKTSLLDRPAARLVRAVMRAGLGTRSGALVVNVGSTEVDPVTGGAPEPSRLTYPMRTLPGEDYLGSLGLDPGTLVEQNQRAILVAGDGMEPTPEHRFLLDGREWSVGKVRPISSGERNALYLLILEVA